MKFHHPLDFSWYYKPRVLFTSGREWPKVDGTTSSSSLRTWFSCYTLVRDEQGLFCLFSILCLLLGSLRLGLFIWASSFGSGCVHPTKSTTNVVMGFPSSWTFISKYSLDFYRYLQWVFWAINYNVWNNMTSFQSTFENNLYYDGFHNIRGFK